MSLNDAEAEMPGQEPAPGRSEQPVDQEEEPALEAGSVVSPSAEPLVDPAVSRAKFDRQVADYRRMHGEYLRRGWMMVHAEFPEVTVLFGAPQLAPMGVLFGVVVDFTNYDLWAPSVKFVDPFTLEPLRADQVLPVLKRPRNVWPGVPVAAMPMDGEGPLASEAAPAEDGQPGRLQDEVPGQPAIPMMLQFIPQPEPQNLMQAHAVDGKPFLCMAGVREYHEHPFHSNDPWLAHRGTGVGTLYHILDVIHRHGVAPIKEWRYKVRVEVAGVGLDLMRLPE